MNYILKLIYPNKCPFCRKIISYDEFACDKCFSSLNNQSTKKIFKFKGGTFISVSAFAYENEVKNAIWRLKFRNHKENALPFSIAINKALENLLPGLKVDFITSVPISRKRLKDRGYNQTELFAKDLSRIRHTKYKRLLVKNINNLEQHTLPVTERSQNVDGVYSTKNFGIIKDKKILLCDDIITTGNTMGECRKVLLDAGAKEVICATIAFVKAT